MIRLGSGDNFVWNAADKTLAVMGLAGCVFVNTGDAPLVCPREKAQGSAESSMNSVASAGRS